MRGKKYYFNTKSRKSCWEKPLELMTQVEKADITTDWREHTAPDGRKFFFNKVTGDSKWQMPEVVKNARLKIVSEMVAKKIPEHDACVKILASHSETETNTHTANETNLEMNVTLNDRDKAREIF
jgi:pre-mRNA-processing factor 40